MIGVVGEGEPADRAVAALRRAGHEPAVAPADELDPAAIEVAVAVGESAVIDLVRTGFDAPLCPVAVDDGLPSVSVGDTVATVEAYLTGEASTRRHPLLSVRADGEAVGAAVFDAMLVRSEPGRISEFSLSATGVRSRFRADGVVTATPAGSHGYARAAGGSRLGHDTGSVVVVPVAAFGLGAPTWVLDPAAGLELGVERDEGDVTLLVDGRPRRSLAGEASVTLSLGETFETVGRDTG